MRPTDLLERPRHVVRDPRQGLLQLAVLLLLQTGLAVADLLGEGDDLAGQQSNNKHQRLAQSRFKTT